MVDAAAPASEKGCTRQRADGPEKDEQPAGRSGHSRCRKARFAGTLSSIYCALAVCSVAKDLYLEKLGAHPIGMGVLFFIVSFAAPVNEILSGRLQNKNALKRCFPLEIWGRKAPWLSTHVVLLAIATGVLFLPPRNTIALHAWFTVDSILIFWAISTCLIAFESCRQELYPYNEERSEVEVLCKFGCIVGIGYASLPMLVLMAQASLMLRVAASVLFFIGILMFGMQAKVVWLQANSLNAEGVEEETSLLDDFRMTWSNRAFRHLCMVRLYDGLYQGLQSTNLLYYLTYILMLHGAERSGWIVLVGSANMIGDVVVALVVGRAMQERQNSFRIQAWVVWLRMFNAVTTVALLAFPVHIGLSNIDLARGLFMIWTTINRICQSPFSFWRVSAQCWIVDEDIHAGCGVRREAAFIGVASAVANFARAFAAAFSFMGYGLVGLAPRACYSECPDEAADCVDACMDLSIAQQPDALRWYIRLLNIVGLVVIEMLLVYHTNAFPIKGIRLARLYNNQALALGGKVDQGTASVQMEKLQEKGSPNMKDMVQASPGKSIVFMDTDAGASVQHVSQLQDMGKSRKVREVRVPSKPDASGALAEARSADATPVAPNLATVAQEHCNVQPLAFPVNMNRCYPYLGSLSGRQPCAQKTRL